MNKMLIVIYVVYIIFDLFKKVVFLDVYDCIIFIIIFYLSFTREFLGISEVMVIGFALICYLVNFILKKIVRKRCFIVSRFEKITLENYNIKILIERKKEKIIVVEKNQMQLLPSLRCVAKNYTIRENVFEVISILLLLLIAFYIPA